jgi:Uncharacterized protein conserved in bacteria (DUF2188)
MPQRRPAISVEPRPDGRWAVQKDGTKRASRVMDRKQGAVNRARQQARREQAELVIKDQPGRIQSKDSHGHDPRRSKG